MRYLKGSENEGQKAETAVGRHPADMTVRKGRNGMEILQRVRECYDNLSPVQKRIADYIFKYPDRVCFLSLKDLAESLGVTEVTVLRFVKKIGLKSYVQLKEALREHLQGRFSFGDSLNRISDDVGGKRESDADKAKLYEAFVENEICVLKETYRKVEPERVREAVSMILQARCVYVAGTELVTGLCSYLTRRLLTIGLMSVDLSNMSRAIYSNYVSHIGPEDAVIIISAPGYARYIVNTARFLERKRVPQIVITDRPSAPAAAYGTTVLCCGNHDLFFYNSVLGYMSLANMLVYFTAIENPEKTNRLRGMLSQAREAIGTEEILKDVRSVRAKKTDAG